MVFREYGIVMMASVLHCQRAIEVNIQIICAFLRMWGNLNSQRNGIGEGKRS
jgi:hypothetical protein